jgi:hypothetical protein
LCVAAAPGVCVAAAAGALAVEEPAGFEEELEACADFP